MYHVIQFKTFKHRYYLIEYDIIINELNYLCTYIGFITLSVSNINIKNCNIKFEVSTYVK